MEKDSRPCFPIFEWAKNKQNPLPSTKLQQLSYSATQILAKNNPCFPSNTSIMGSPSITPSTTSRRLQLGLEPPSATDLPRNNSIEEQKQEKKKVSQNKARTNYVKDIEASNNLQDAFKAYEDGKNKETGKTEGRLPNGKKSSIRNVADFYGVAASTLATRTSGKQSIEKPPQVGRPPVFSQEELNDIVQHLLLMADLGYGYTEFQSGNLIRYIAHQKANNKSTFKASHGFMCHLFVQFPELALRRASSFEYLRASSLTKDLIARFFLVLGKAYSICQNLSGKETEPKCIWAMDEMGIRLSDCGGLNIVARKGVRNVSLISPKISDHITVVFCCNARGYSLEPCFILRNASSASNFFNHCKLAGFQNPLVLNSKKAFIDFDCFESWAKYFAANAKFNAADSLTLIYDGHSTHTMNYEALKYLNSEKIFAVCIPAHSSHLFNVADVTVFSRLKAAFKTKQLDYKRNINRDISLNDVPYIFKLAWDDAVSQNGIINGTYSYFNL